CLIVLLRNESLQSAVYVNVAQLRQSLSESPPPASYPEPEGWEVHVDQESGQEYYYHPATGRTTWDNPFLDSPTDPEPAEELCSPPQSPALSQSTASPSAWTADWEQLVDATSGLPYFYNPMSGETSWEPPEQPSPYTPQMEPMSVHRFHEDGPVRTARLEAKENMQDGSKSQWSLPEVNRFPRFCRLHDIFFSLDIHRSSFRLNCEIVQNLEKAGILNKTKVCENGKKVRKNWTQTWTVLHGGVLTFHKDPKSAPTGALVRFIVPEVAVDLRGATISWASKEKSSKKNVLELKGKNGMEFLVQYDTESIINDWYKVLVDTIRQNLYKCLPSVSSASRPSVTSSTSTSAADTDPKKVRTKLMKFLLKRPTLQSVKEKGYIRDNVFGCHLDTLCALEKSTVPSFVEKCIRAVEKRGLDIDGLYRVSGNLAVIQKLRFKADHEELDLEDGQWEDVHVITGALKLFFRELPEPLFPFSHFHKFIGAIKIPDYNTKLSHIIELVQSLPPSNHDTMKLLFGHLNRLIKYGENNRMTAQNVAIVFGPTLLRPEMESSNLAMHMIYQNQIVEFILREYELIFNSS
uniref:Rho GTPase activating protein 27 n=1 Tax=Salarias fasciatus TaxID=181472 RepID=A0A672H3Y2_SALFA